MRTTISETTASQFIGRKFGATAAGIWGGRVREFLTHLRQTAPDRGNTPTEFFAPHVGKSWPMSGSFRVTRGIDGKRFELINQKKGFIVREVK